MDRSLTLGDAIRARRLELGWTQEELAERIGVGDETFRQSDVSRLERGKVALPRRGRLERIAAALDLPLGDLLARSGWAGAEAAFVHLPIEADGDRGYAVRRSAPTTPFTTPARPLMATAATPVAASPRFRAAVDRAHELEAWSADLLRQTAATVERFNRVQQVQAMADTNLRPQHIQHSGRERA